MEEDIKVDEAFKKSFNLGYRVAAELNLKVPLLQNQEKLIPENPMHLGMLYINIHLKHLSYV